MGLDLQPDGLTAGLAGHCQPDKKIRKKKEWFDSVCFKRNNFTSSALIIMMLSQIKAS